MRSISCIFLKFLEKIFAQNMIIPLNRDWYITVKDKIVRSFEILLKEC